MDEYKDWLEDEVEVLFDKLLGALKANRPEERGELSRRYAIAITETEKAFAYYNTFIFKDKHELEWMEELAATEESDG